MINEIIRTDEMNVTNVTNVTGLTTFSTLEEECDGVKLPMFQCHLQHWDSQTALVPAVESTQSICHGGTLIQHQLQEASGRCTVIRS